MVMKLCDSSDSDTQDISKIEINQEIARRHEHNKKREDLQRPEELDVSGESDGEESSDEASEDDGREDLEYFDGLIKIRNNDRTLIENKETKLFASEETVKKGRKKDNKKFIKDVTAKQLLEEGPEFEDGEEDFKGVKSYSEEQEELKRPFLEQVEADDDGDEFFMVKVRDIEIEDEDDENANEVTKKLDEYFGEDEKLDENSMFLKDYLKDYFRNKMWLDRGDSGGKRMDDDDDIGVSEDEEEVEKQEDYEREFNFRFEENPGDRVIGHSRVVEGSVRKKTNTRKLQRERKEERIAQAEYARKEELKYLKNLKKKEMNEKLKKIRDTAGIGDGRDCPLDLDDLEEEFDPEEHDKKMRVAFDDDYYEADDANPEFGSDKDEEGDELVKPDFDKEDELFGLAKGWDDMENSGDRFEDARERIITKQADKEEVATVDECKQKKKNNMSALEEEVIKKELDEYYKLDYEDTIGDLKTKFKYRPVNAKRYGLNTNAVLWLDDKELNQHVPLKKIAPYREKEWKVPHAKVYNQKLKIISLLQGETSDGQNSRKRKFRDDEGTSRDDKKLHNEELNIDLNNLSKSSKRRHRQAAFKLTQTRLMAYGKIPSNSKSKKS